MLTKPERDTVPIWIASLGKKNVAATAEYADGWLPHLFLPELADKVWGESLAAGAAKRPDRPRPAADRRRRHGRDRRGRQGLLDFARPMFALYVGGMGAKGKNFYNDLACSTATRRRPSRSRTSTSRARRTRPRPRCRTTGSSWQPGRTGVLRQGADRGLQRGRRHPPAGHPGHRGPGRGRRPAQGVGLVTARRIFTEEHEAFRQTVAHLHRARGRAAPQAVGGRRRRRPRGLAQGRRAGAALLRRRRGVRRRRDRPTSATTRCWPRR